MGFAPHALSPSELAGLLEAERQSVAFLAYRDGTGDLRLEPLDGLARVAIGRAEQNDLALEWDPEVSRAHAQLEHVGGAWTLVDDGLSRNGSFVNGERILGRRRLDDGDLVRLGRSSLLFRAPSPAAESTAADDLATLARLTDGERRVLVALCRPLMGPQGGLIPASNREIADELHLSLPGVKTHIRALFAKLDIDDLPQYRKRTELARRALDAGLVTPHDLSA
jgi:pSer/pThr/pTyr-binding forkhead associated (FHA) protein